MYSHSYPVGGTCHADDAHWERSEAGFGCCLETGKFIELDCVGGLRFGSRGHSEDFSSHQPRYWLEGEGAGWEPRPRRRLIG